MVVRGVGERVTIGVVVQRRLPYTDVEDGLKSGTWIDVYSYEKADLFGLCNAKFGGLPAGTVAVKVLYRRIAMSVDPTMNSTPPSKRLGDSVAVWENCFAQPVHSIPTGRHNPPISASNPY